MKRIWNPGIQEWFTRILILSSFPGFLICFSASAASVATEKVAYINIDGAIGPATASYISRSIDEARSQNAQCLIIQLNTPGGLLDSTQKIVQSFLGSSVPVVVYVAPTGATATSAGCFITIAASVAAMAPATTIGAAHPVSIGGFPSGGEEKPDETMKQKLENFSVSYIETIAGKRQRNIEWAKSAVKESASITAEKALELKVIDLIASNVTELVLIALALMLFIFDVYAPTHGVLTVGGVIAFLIGSLMLFNRADPLYRLSLSYIIPATLVTAAFFIFIIGKGLRAQLLPVKVGKETLIGKTVTALTPIDSRSGRIFVEGEYWNAISDTPIEKDEQAEISAVQGLTVKVKTKGK